MEEVKALSGDDNPVEEYLEDIVALTPKAAAKFKEACDAEKKSYELRLGVRGGGCAGLQYVLEFNDRKFEFDNTFEQYGVTIFIDPNSSMHLEGSILRYVTSLNGGGFKFENKHATKSCGCGSSFG
ncbi:MAG: iron-sulfur cluster assembly accessory protein [Nanoarchaeota archaeon]|nr:iron-sulfur cluster assembly accessory protein [Nanoarchaeota archaeon]